MIAPNTETKTPATFKPGAANWRLPLWIKVCKVPPIKAPITPKNIVESQPPPCCPGTIALAIAPESKPKTIQAMMFITSPSRLNDTSNLPVQPMDLYLPNG